MNTKLSLCMIVKADNEEAKLLDRALSYVSKHVDEICITITGENKECERVAKKYKANISHFEWVNDFAKARNFNFSQATGDYIFWIDADDVVRNAELLKPLVEKMEKEKTDTIIMNYLYDFDKQKRCTVKHLKTRIVKKGCVEWVGELHEDFNNLRELKSFMTEEIEILHLTNEKRADVAGKRNYDIAKQANDKYPDDPRSYWLMANASVGVGKRDEAYEWYVKFIDSSNSDEEKFIAWLRIGEIKQEETAFLTALSIRPTYPDAYIKLGELYYNQKKFERARDFLLEGLKKNVPDRSIVVYNPRDYDFFPMMILAQVYYELKQYKNVVEVLKRCSLIYPKHPQIEAVKKMIEKEEKMDKEVEAFLEKAEKIKDKKYLKKLCDGFKYQSHPKFCLFKNIHFIKETSSGKDLVYYCSYTSKVWNPEIAAKSGVGGSEEAVINLSKGLAEKGWNVTVYNNCGEAGVFDGVQYKPYWDFNIRDKQDVLILWRHPKPLDFDINADRIFLDLHDVVPAGELTPERVAKIEKIMVKTHSHMDLFPDVPKDKFEIVPNGLDVSMFDVKIERDPYLVLNTSSPDRHIDATIQIFERLIEVSDKPWKLAWYYGWDNMLEWHKDDKELMAYYDKWSKRFEALKKKGRAEGGMMISHQEIANKYKEAGVFLYPTQFYEIHCISAAKAQAAGCKVITSDAFALNETVQFGKKVHTDCRRWKEDRTFGDVDNIDEYVREILETDGQNVDTSAQEKWAKETFSWETVVNNWNNIIK